MVRNIARLRGRLAGHGVNLRPHLKTGKSLDVARRVMDGPGGPITVSTLREAEQFAEGGVRDILYAVGIAPAKLERVTALRRRGVDLSVVVDSLDAAHAVAQQSRISRDPIPTLIEIDSDGHRAGVSRAAAGQLIAIGRALHEGGASLRGVMTHAGESYSCDTVDAIVAMAERERAEAVGCAAVLRDAGLPAPVVSVGSTPTAHFARDLSGVTEVRAGVFVFFDLVMAGLNVCAVDDIALSVLATVIGHQSDKGWILVDAGWMAMSRDRGTASQKIDQGYGIVCDVDGVPYPDLIMAGANQEQGILALRDGSAAQLPQLPIGSQVRILPNHACPTAAQHDYYTVVRTGSREILDKWSRFRGW
ncbi:DSD1 family PLP-dependent enzyme [Paraburkholderia sp. FT54]|uniref:DSD1 family PLP-dependent enzyme n=1 Tax=Paraburkholderia sp. FT54 TaxID=3074437 RepID=UPI002877EC1D|nr:DSD1 family PLP-dependent enzyme [Paraburkholderia sp. FT54]WNC95136.1 DSD1 family PLP-dependent enzyme [Paraburkholderia sp. FT54]